MELIEVDETSQTPVPDVVEPTVARQGRGLGILGGIVFLFLGLGIAAIGYWVFLSGSPPPPPVQPTPAPVAPVPPPQPEPEPEPSVLSFATEPNGASVTLDGEDICITPCEIELAEDATLPVTYSVQLEGHVPEDYTITERAGNHHLRLVKKTNRPRPRPRPSPEPTPVPETVRPVPAAPRPEPEPDPKPDPKPEIEILDEVRDPFK